MCVSKDVRIRRYFSKPKWDPRIRKFAKHCISRQILVQNHDWFLPHPTKFIPHLELWKLCSWNSITDRLKAKEIKVLSVSMVQRFPKQRYFFWRFPAVTHLSWEKWHAAKDECGVLAEWSRGGGTKVLGENPLSVPLCTIQIIWTRSGSNRGLRVEKPPINGVTQGRALFETEMSLH